MDTQDFEVTAREAFAYIERVIDHLALDGVEAYPIDRGLKLLFEDGSDIEFTRNDDALHIEIQRSDGSETLYWDAVEEQWYARSNELPLPSVLADLLGQRLARPVDCSDVE
jgi:hypothetical protein